MYCVTWLYPGLTLPHRTIADARQGSEPFESAVRVWSVGHVLRQRPVKAAVDCVSRATDDVGLDKRLGIARMEEEIRAKKCPFCFIEEQTCVPAVRHMRGCKKLKAVSAGLQNFVIGKRPRRAVRKVVDHHHRADNTANRPRVRSNRKQLV